MKTAQSRRKRASSGDAKSKTNTEKAKPFIPTKSVASRFHIAVSNQSKISKRICSELKRVALHVAVSEGFRSGTLSIAIVGDRRMAAIHRDFLNEPEPTDVITFDLGTDQANQRIEGEILVCSDVARRASRQSGLPARRALARELVLYTAHGVLHLAGHDDRSSLKFKRMHAAEDRYLVQLGWEPAQIAAV